MFGKAWLLRVAAISTIIAWPLVGECSIQGNSQLDLIASQNPLRHDWVNHHNFGIIRTGSGWLYDGHSSREQWEGGGSAADLQIEHEASLIERPIVGRAIVDASNKGDWGEERKFSTLICPRGSPHCVTGADSRAGELR